ncbi:MAG: hypothetical protein A2782_03200 [Candidatus Blackburnbacteria bacterium RIFCSPHIGHO2_01_FULL_43_15b]|uniref:Uncharacterized protein n=1 Tax=Candidatus Blackburnbacteria bacterium RIFCSPHIGHO2_01_FULL_43_15b TaxID=1797513 RepID=A0A1G1V195_9BACT|nr:MAG: hypothetical protein A2782_03200 [Candidatus Blackburnbacteria bacterium RIFCSPHIGHO2_01_FULL_43_15b]
MYPQIQDNEMFRAACARGGTQSAVIKPSQKVCFAGQLGGGVIKNVRKGRKGSRPIHDRPCPRGAGRNTRHLSKTPTPS